MKLAEDHNNELTKPKTQEGIRGSILTGSVRCLQVPRPLHTSTVRSATTHNNKTIQSSYDISESTRQVAAEFVNDTIEVTSFKNEVKFGQNVEDQTSVTSKRESGKQLKCCTTPIVTSESSSAHYGADKLAHTEDLALIIPHGCTHSLHDDTKYSFGDARRGCINNEPNHLFGKDRCLTYKIIGIGVAANVI